MDINSIEGLNEDEIMNLFNDMTDISHYNNIAAHCPPGVKQSLQCYDTAGGFGGTCYWSGCNSNGDTVCVDHFDSRYGFTHVFKCTGMKNSGHLCGIGQTVSLQCYDTAGGFGGACYWTGCVSSSTGGSTYGGCVAHFDSRYGLTHLFKCSGR